ncbi:contractile injection system protein, VgrG/Pvc8 family [Brevundimonas faecalis]|uniref:contractile injection system protein, VgrG/Pvc8 family n=1 Tax=Brevundimonas faecalis TaxID=947378 RepID=UPI00361741A9
MKPDFRLTVGSDDRSAVFRSRLMRIVVTDNSGEDADTVEIVLDDAGNIIDPPKRGVVLGVSLGWAGGELSYLGRFTVDEAEPEGPPDIITIRAKAADMRAGLKAQQTRAWHDTTIGAIVAKIAADHGLTPAVASDLASKAVAHIDQANESDMHFLTRLGRLHGAVAAPKDGRLVFAPATTGLSASGQALPSVVLDRARGDLIRWRQVSADREEHGSVRARWRDASAGRTRFVTAGSGDPKKTLRNIHPTHAAAKAAAEAELAKSKRAQNGVELTATGRAEIMAQTPLTVRGLREELSGEWIVETVEHTADFEGGGFTSRITGRRKADTNKGP